MFGPQHWWRFFHRYRGHPDFERYFGWRVVVMGILLLSGIAALLILGAVVETVGNPFSATTPQCKWDGMLGGYHVDLKVHNPSRRQQRRTFDVICNAFRPDGNASDPYWRGVQQVVVDVAAKGEWRRSLLFTPPPNGAKLLCFAEMKFKT